MAEQKKVLITGAGGLIGSACASLLAERGWQVVGVDNNMRQQFFGSQGSTSAVVADLAAKFPKAYRHEGLDIRDRQSVRELFQRERRILSSMRQRSHRMIRPLPFRMTISM